MRRRLPRVRRGAVGPPGERWTPDSIQLPAILPNCVGYEARPASPDGLSAVTLEDLVSDALRMNPDRILVGECRGPETMAMLWAFATGHAGMTSVHGESAEHALRNLARFALTSGARIEAEQALDWLREIDVVIHCDRRRSFDGGERRFLPRRIDEIAEVSRRPSSDSNSWGELASNGTWKTAHALPEEYHGREDSPVSIETGIPSDWRFVHLAPLYDHGREPESDTRRIRRSSGAVHGHEHQRANTSRPAVDEAGGAGEVGMAVSRR